MAMSRQHVTRTKKFSMIRLHSKQVVSTKTAQHSIIERMVVVVGWGGGGRGGHRTDLIVRDGVSDLIFRHAISISRHSCAH